jgi:hypothetical protein
VYGIDAEHSRVVPLQVPKLNGIELVCFAGTTNKLFICGNGVVHELEVFFEPKYKVKVVSGTPSEPIRQEASLLTSTEISPCAPLSMCANEDGAVAVLHNNGTITLIEKGTKTVIPAYGPATALCFYSMAGFYFFLQPFRHSCLFIIYFIENNIFCVCSDFSMFYIPLSSKQLRRLDGRINGGSLGQPIYYLNCATDDNVLLGYSANVQVIINPDDVLKVVKGCANAKECSKVCKLEGALGFGKVTKDELALVQRGWANVLSSLPPAKERKKFNT